MSGANPLQSTRIATVLPSLLPESTSPQSPTIFDNVDQSVQTAQLQQPLAYSYVAAAPRVPKDDGDRSGFVTTKAAKSEQPFVENQSEKSFGDSIQLPIST